MRDVIVSTDRRISGNALRALQNSSVTGAVLQRVTKVPQSLRKLLRVEAVIHAACG
jgi:hypothetical protein